MQAIETKYLPYTNTRNSRIVAKCVAKRIVVSYDHGLGVEGNHDAAAFELAKRLGWSGAYVKGGNIDGSGNVYVNMTNNPAAFAVMCE